MSAGLLQFTLGLTTGAFVGPLGAADAKLKGFIGGMLSLTAIVEGVQKQFEKGAGLKQLSDQTGASIANLYRLQQGFKAVGLDAGDVGTALYTLNKALGGITEQGEPTGFVFAQLGLNIENLTKLDAPQQLLNIAEALNKMDASSASAAVSRIFGKYGGAQEFLQLSRNADDFADALRRGGVQAAVFDRFGRTFEKIEILTGQLKEKLGGIFLGIAAGMGPALENVLKMLNEVDLSKIGVSIGKFLSALTQSFREGKFSELIGDSLRVGFDSILVFAPAIFEKVGYFLIKAFETPLIYIQAGMEYALSKAGDTITKSPWFHTLANVMLGAPVADQLVDAASGASFDQILAERKKDGVKFDLGSGEFSPDDINSDANDRFKQAIKDFKNLDSVKGLESLVNNLNAKAPGPDAARGGGGSKETFGVAYNREHTALEKLGFVFRGGAGSDPQHQTARNTRDTAQTLKEMLATIKQHHAAAPLGDPFMNGSAI